MLAALLLLTVSELASQGASTIPTQGRVIIVVLDLSYSMGLETGRGSERRVDLAVRALRELERRASPDESWYVQIVGGAGDGLPRQEPLPAASIDWTRLPRVGGTTALVQALGAAADALASRGGSARRVLLVSDGIETSAEPFEVPNAGYFLARGTQVSALIYGLQDMETVQSGLRRFSEATGGSTMDLRTVADTGAWNDVLRILRQPDPVRTARVIGWRAVPRAGPAVRAERVEASGAAARAEAGMAPAAHFRATVRPLEVQRAGPPDGSGAGILGRTIQVRLIWLALPMLPVAGIGLGRRIAAILRSLSRATTDGADTVLRLEVRTPGEPPRTVDLGGLPIRAGASDRARLRLGVPGGTTLLPDFELREEEEGLVLVSAVPLNINGVARRRKVLRVGDVVGYAGCRLVYRASTRWSEDGGRVVGGLPWELLLLGVPLLAGILYREPIPVTLPSPAARVAREWTSGEPQVWRLEASADRPPAPASPPVRVRAVAGGGGRAAAALAVRSASVTVPLDPLPDVDLEPKSAAPDPVSPVRVFGPGEDLEGLRVDALFLHAHPDDESIDFAALLRRVTAAGHTAAVVLFTDGEAGLDQYPDRPVGGVYPPRDLAPAELGVVRTEEATLALARLGATAYIRLGLPNHPYASITQVLSQERLMEEWGGEDALVERVARIIETLRPVLVVSPDSAHGGAHEHFEHAGVGLVVREALRRVRERGDHDVRAHLRSVDPRFVQSYGPLEVVDTLAVPRSGGWSLRAAQILALRAHVTQRDATVIAVESLSSRRYEYYAADYVGDSGPLDRFLGAW